MNVEQQKELIRRQVDEIEPTDHVRVLPGEDPLRLDLELVGHGNRHYHIRLDLQDYDIEPARVFVLDESGEVTWDRSKLPPPPFTHGTMHPIHKRDFFCILGTHDYHSHPLHKHEAWDALRNTHPLSMLVARLSETIRKPPRLRVMISNLSEVPLTGLQIVFTNGATLNLEGMGVDARMQQLNIILANGQVIEIVNRDVT